MKYRGTMDEECVALCDALNRLPGIRTMESCCGHGEQPYRIWFRADTLSALPRLLWCFDGCHCGYYGWRVIAQTDCGMSPVSFMVEGPRGSQAYEEANGIAELVIENVPQQLSRRRRS